jgi:hypothetical protein
MAQINTPIRLRFLRIPTKWELRVIKGETRREDTLNAFGYCKTQNALNRARAVELDAWGFRDDFFALAENDNEALLTLLEKGGKWGQTKEEAPGTDALNLGSDEANQHYRKGNPCPLFVSDVWLFREALKRCLQNKSAFKETYAPLLKQPGTGFHGRGVEFPFCLELTNVVLGVVTVSDIYEALLATVFFDVARGIRFKTCARKDCGKPFPIESRHKKKYCKWYCAHFEAVRRKRNADRLGKARARRK